MKPQNSMWFTFHTVDWRNSAPNQQAWFSPIVTSGFFSQLVWHRFGAMSFVAAWVSLATFGRARTKAWHEQRQEEPAIPCWWNQAKMWQQMKSYFGHLHIQLLEVFTRIEIYLVYILYVYIYIYYWYAYPATITSSLHYSIIQSFPSLTLGTHGSHGTLQSPNEVNLSTPGRVLFLATSLGEVWKIIQIVNH